MAVDKLQYGVGNAASSTLGSGMASGDTSTPTLASSTNFQAAPTPGAGMVLVDEGAGTEELMYSTGISGGALTTPIANRGLEGGSAQTHAANATIKGVMTVGMWNNLITALTNVVLKTTGALDTTKVVDLTTSQKLSAKVMAPTLTTDVDGATITFDMSSSGSGVHNVVLGGNRILAVSNVSVGQCFIIRLTQDGTGTRTVTWFSTIKWAGGSAPTLTTTINKADVFGFLCTSSGNYDGFIIGQNL